MKIVFVLILLVLFISGCDWTTFADRISSPKLVEINSTNTTLPIIKRINSIHFASWDIDKLTQAKLRESSVKYGIQDTIQQFDLIAIQGIQDSEQKVVSDLLVDYKYDYIISGQLGKEEPKEQFAFVYNTEIIQVLDKATYKDTKNYFERDPFIGYFKVGDYDFIIIQLNTKANDATQEIINIQNVYDYAIKEFGDKDIIILGNLNADCLYYNTKELTKFKWLIDEFEDTTTTTNDCAYDRIIVNDEIYDNILSSAVYKMIDDELATVISSHYPIHGILSIPNIVIDLNESDIQE